MRVTDRNDVIIIDNLATGPAGSPSTPGRVEAGAGSRGALLGFGHSSPTPMMCETRRRSCFLRWPGRRGCRARSPVWILRCRWDSQGVALGRGCGGDLCPGTGSTGGLSPSGCARLASCRRSACAPAGEGPPPLERGKCDRHREKLRRAGFPRIVQRSSFHPRRGMPANLSALPAVSPPLTLHFREG